MKTITLTVSQFNNFIKNILDSEDFLSSVAITGEVTNCKVSGTNTFFDLKDSGAMISCVKFGLPYLSIKNGDFVTVYGRVNFYVKSGKVTFVTARAELAGMGLIYQKFLELKEKLEKEGLFKQELKKSIPRFANNIGIVTSETGAVIKDIINVTRKKNPYTNLIVFPSKMQGEGAENEIVLGIRYFNTRNDINTIIVARGGGSMEDLSPFNTELVARAVFESNIPVISAVGHETDFTLCDFAADLRVPTPSVAAEVAVFNYYEELNNILQISDHNSKAVVSKIDFLHENINNITDSITKRFELKISREWSRISSSITIIENMINRILADKKSRLDSVSSAISKQNPMERLKRGYTVVERDGKRISSANDLCQKDHVVITFYDGKVAAQICEKIKGENHGV